MQIQSDYSASALTLNGQQTTVGDSAGTADFAAALAKAADKTQTVEEKMRQEAAARTDASKQANNEAVNALQDYMSKPLAAHMREAILKEMGLTEADVKAMPPEKQQMVEGEISRRMRERMLGQKDGGQQTDLSALQDQTGQLQGGSRSLDTLMASLSAQRASASA